MDIILHTGAHFTEEERVMKCLLRNKGDFAARGVSVPGPGRYREVLNGTLAAMRDAEASPDAREMLLDQILDDEKATRLILSDASFFSMPRNAFQHGLLYPHAPDRITRLLEVFPNDQVELFMAIRNPALFLPAVYNRGPKGAPGDFMGLLDPCAILWSDTIARIRAKAPHMPITLWCYEDLPLTWAQVIRELAGLEHGEKIIGGFDVLQSIITQQGMARFRRYLNKNPNMTEIEKRRVMVDFIDRFLIEENVEVELDAPGWTAQLVQDMTEVYEEDLDEIAHMPGVDLILP